SGLWLCSLAVPGCSKRGKRSMERTERIPRPVMVSKLGLRGSGLFVSLVQWIVHLSRIWGIWKVQPTV
ncbi:hypothetical protein GOODEAATRI_029114, partial [Goodea atripinnis]